MTSTTTTPSVPLPHPSACLFEAVVHNDCQGLAKLYAANARISVVSYLSMRNRWSNVHHQQQQDNYKSGMYDYVLYLYYIVLCLACITVFEMEMTLADENRQKSFLFLRKNSSKCSHVNFQMSLSSHEPFLLVSLTCRGEIRRVSTTTFVSRQ